MATETPTEIPPRSVRIEGDLWTRAMRKAARERAEGFREQNVTRVIRLALESYVEGEPDA